MIKNIRLRNFKCYKDKTFELKGLSIFCGNNSVGKSTTIQSVLMAVQSDFSSSGVPYNGDFILRDPLIISPKHNYV
ncbi:TPA: AAA family ATPase [Vibrio campbellii]|nr:AAA family ATPase [Vibrio campbellii]